MENEQNKMNTNTENEEAKIKINIEENTRRGCCKICVGWFLQILILAGIASLIFCAITKFKLWFIVLFVFVIIYAIYLYKFFKANTFKFLSHISDSEGIYKILEKNFTQSPEIFVTIRCYHYIRTGRRNYRQSVTKLRKSFPFPYYSWKDISGLFLLNQDKAKKYPFLKLYLRYEINFADSISYSDLSMYKNILYQQYKDYDAHFSIYDDRIIPDFKEFFLVTLDPNNIPCCVSKGLYILFTIFFLGQFYKTYLQSKCFAKNFAIRKLFSTRFDLTNNQNYYQMEPGYKFNEKLVVFERKNIGKINENYQLIQPSQDELNNANQYNIYIPNYQAINVGEPIGIVQDAPPVPILNNNPAIQTQTINVEKK